MKLLLDLGNTRLKWALVSAQGDFLLRGATSDSAVPPQARDQILDACGDELISHVALCSVGSSGRGDSLIEFLNQWLGLVPIRVKSREARAGLRNGYADPARLGVDRWMAMLGARTHGNCAWLVVDAGTALTIDAISRDGHHLGGYIVPGYRAQLSLLETATAAVGRADGRPARGWGRDTRSAVLNGVLLSFAALIERARVELAYGLEDTCRVAITGGDAAMLAPHLSCDPLVDSDLLFRGMLVDLLEPGQAP